MGIANLFVQHWDSILIVVLFLFVIAFLIYRGEKGILDQIIYRVVTELEREYGSGTGNLKLAAAIDILYPKLPRVIQLFATAERIQKWIEDGLTAAKDKWAKNPALAEYVRTVPVKTPEHQE